MTQNAVRITCHRHKPVCMYMYVYVCMHACIRKMLSGLHVIDTNLYVCICMYVCVHKMRVQECTIMHGKHMHGVNVCLHVCDTYVCV